MHQEKSLQSIVLGQNPTKVYTEENLHGNVCRCISYRSIFEYGMLHVPFVQMESEAMMMVQRRRRRRRRRQQQMNQRFMNPVVYHTVIVQNGMNVMEYIQNDKDNNPNNNCNSNNNTHKFKKDKHLHPWIKSFNVNPKQIIRIFVTAINNIPARTFI